MQFFAKLIVKTEMRVLELDQVPGSARKLGLKIRFKLH